MSFRISTEIRYNVFEPSTIILNLHALETSHQKLAEEYFTVTQGASCEFFPSGPGQNRYVRIATGSIQNLLITYSVLAETNPDSRSILQIEEIPVSRIQQDALPFLFPSRYCESDRLWRLAARHFGGIRHPLAQAAAISDWIFENLEYQTGITDPSSSACDTLVQRAGVCRDFAHLGIALCRALSIPARYFAGYACGLQRQDFHACFEVCVGNQWFIFDPTRLSSPNGLVRIATGRDASDASFATLFGAVEMQSMQVQCTSDSFQPLSPAELQGKAVLLEP